MSESKRIVLVLTEQQASNFRGMLDLAVKAGGLQVAEPAVELDKLLLAAATAPSGEALTGENPESVL